MPDVPQARRAGFNAITRRARAVLAAAGIGFVAFSSGTTAMAAIPPPVAQSLAAAGIPESSVALYVQEIGAAKPLVAHAAEKPLNPASTMKLVTTYAALELLGPAFTWSTDVYASAPIRNEVIEGDLVIKGSGDPKLTLENFWLLLRNLRGRGVREIRGDLVLDRTHFAAGDFDPARFDGDPLRPYNTGPDALLVNFKSMTIQFVPELESQTVRLIAEPPLAPLQLINAISLSEGTCGDWVSKLKFDAQGSGDTARFTVSGTYARDCGERTRSFSVLDHRAYVGALFTYLWKELGGTFTGKVRDGTVPAGARLLASATSPQLSEVVRDINKFSNNVMARQLFLTLAVAIDGAPGTTEKARAVVRRWLEQKKIPIPELTMENGSGLSRIERISARSMGELLLAAFRSAVMPELIASLPVFAVDGTMRKRLGQPQVAGQAHIKGGTLTGVRAIAGYVLDAQGRRVVVVFIVNHANAPSALAAQDALLRWIHQR